MTQLQAVLMLLILLGLGGVACAGLGLLCRVYAELFMIGWGLIA